MLKAGHAVQFLQCGTGLGKTAAQTTDTVVENTEDEAGMAVNQVAGTVTVAVESQAGIQCAVVQTGG